MKISVSSYSFHRLMEDGRENQLSIIKLASELGFDGIEFCGIEPHDDRSVSDYAKILKDETDRVGLPISSFVFGADLLNDDGELERLKEKIDLAEILGVPAVRHDVASPQFPVPSFYSVLPKVADACREITEYASQKGIVTTVENHGFFFQDSTRMEQLYAAVNHSNFGLLVDAGNFLCADENHVTAVSRLASYAKLAHIKDFHIKSGSEPNPGEGFFKTRGGNYLRGSIIGHGNVKVKQCIEILKTAGYDGYVTLEYEGIEDVLQALRISVANLKNYIRELNA